MMENKDLYHDIFEAIKHIKTVQHTTATLDRILNFIKKEKGDINMEVLKGNINKMVEEKLLNFKMFTGEDYSNVWENDWQLAKWDYFS